MLSRRIFCATMAGAAVLYTAGMSDNALAADENVKKLPAPRKEGGAPIMNAFANRHTSKVKYSDKPVPDDILSDLLWATWGINRPDGKRTAPTALNSQEVNLYVVNEGGVWIYDAKNHSLIKERGGDYRSKVGGGMLIFMYAAPDGIWPGMHVGSIYQNANLYSASIGLGSHVHAGGSDGLDGIVKLPLGYRFWIAHSFGYIPL